MGEIGLAKKSLDYTMVLALTSLGMMFTILMLHGFSAFGFYMDMGVLSILVPTLSVVPALRVLGGVAGRAKGGK